MCYCIVYTTVQYRGRNISKQPQQCINKYSSTLSKLHNNKKFGIFFIYILIKFANRLQNGFVKHLVYIECMLTVLTRTVSLEFRTLFNFFNKQAKTVSRIFQFREDMYKKRVSLSLTTRTRVREVNDYADSRLGWSFFLL